MLGKTWDDPNNILLAVAVVCPEDTSLYCLWKTYGLKQ